MAFGLRPGPEVVPCLPGVDADPAHDVLVFCSRATLCQTPKEAIEGTYIDKKCPFTGNVSVRGRVFRGVVVSTKMTRTVIVRRDYLHYQRKYKRFEKRHRNIPAHASPAFRLRDGDQVTIAQTRPTSKTKRFAVVKLDRAAPDADGKKIFTGA
jgi:small subunit ribosomal protein S11e